MLSIIPVALVTIPWAVGSFVGTSRVVKLAAAATVIAIVSTRHYRQGEGPFSMKMKIKVEDGVGVGNILFQMGKYDETLRPFQGKTFSMTRTEAQSLAYLVEAVLDSKVAIPALVDYLNNFPKSRVNG